MNEFEIYDALYFHVMVKMVQMQPAYRNRQYLRAPNYD